MQTVRLDKERHDRKIFDCGVETLNNYLKLTANQHSDRDNSRTYILEDPNHEGIIVGFYTLAMATIDLSLLPQRLQNKHPRSYSAGLIARLAIDKKYQGKGLGAWLLVDALKKLLGASEVVGFPMIIVDAKDGMSAFYEQFGFGRFKHDSSRLFITVADVRASFEG